MYIFIVEPHSHLKQFCSLRNTVQALEYPSAHAVTLLIKPKWPPQLRFQSDMKTDNTNRLTDPENLYIYQVSRVFKKRGRKKISRQVAAILIIGGKLKF